MLDFRSLGVSGVLGAWGTATLGVFGLLGFESLERKCYCVVDGSEE